MYLIHKFIISVPLWKLNEIRFPNKNLHIDDENLHIGIVLEELKLSNPTSQHIKKLYDKFGRYEIFGRNDVCLVTKLQNRAASLLLHQMLKHRLLDSVSGEGKGKYRFSQKIIF